MSKTISAVVDYCSEQYDQHIDKERPYALAFASVLFRAVFLANTKPDPESELTAWLNRPHVDQDLLRVCQLVLEKFQNLAALPA